LVGGNGRTFHRIVPEEHCVQQADETGLVDFVGHSWTLKREFLRFYLGMKPLTYETGEDMQLAFALQRHGIAAYSPPKFGTKSLRDTEFSSDEHATYTSKPQQPRQWLLCKVIQEGFQPVKCENCTPENVRLCLSNFSDYGDAQFENLRNGSCRIIKKNKMWPWEWM
jgi:hypothetical protein